MELIQRNYMTWALAADAAASTNSSSSSSNSRLSIIPQKEAIMLDVAKDTLSRFDFLLDITGNNETCTNATLNLMGFGNDTIGRGRKNVGRQYVDKLKERGQYEEWNLLDSKLYEYARQLMDVDCEFFLRLLAREEESTMNTTATWPPVSVTTMERKNESITTPSPSAKQNDALPHFMFGFSTGHSGSTAIDRGLKHSDCGWNVVGQFELVHIFEKNGTLNASSNPTADIDCTFTNETVLPFLLKNAKDMARQQQGLDTNISAFTYIDMGHFHNRFRTLECLAHRLGNQATFIRIRRNRYAVAYSFANSFDTPCITGRHTESLTLKHPAVAVCPRSDEGIGAVNLPIDDRDWDELTPFQRFLWYADEIEHRWSNLKSHYGDPSYHEITWSNANELKSGFENLMNKLGCAPTQLEKIKSHVTHDEKALNCSDFIRQDMRYRRSMGYNAQTLQVLVSEKHPQHLVMRECIENRTELAEIIRQETYSDQNKSSSSGSIGNEWIFV